MGRDVTDGTGGLRGSGPTLWGLGIGRGDYCADSRHLFVIGRRRSLPKPFAEIFVPGGYWRRLYSAVSTIRSVFVTRSASNPAATIASAPLSRSTYIARIASSTG